MTIPSNTVIKSNIKAALLTEGFVFTDAPLCDKFVGVIVDEIVNAIKQATVSVNVAVTSVSGVTTGAGVSGPGAGTGSGGLT